MRRRGCSESHWSQFVIGVVHGGGGGAVAEWVRALDCRSGGPAGDAATYFASELCGNFVYPTLPLSFGGDIRNRRSLLSGVYARGSKISHQSALEMCNLSWTPHSSLEKENPLNHSWTTLEINLATFMCYPVSMMCSKYNQSMCACRRW